MESHSVRRMMELHISAVVVYILYLIPCCISRGSLPCTRFRFYSQHMIEKSINWTMNNMLECAVSGSAEGKRMFSYNPHLRLCVIGAPSKGSLSSRLITDKKKIWLLYLIHIEASVREAPKEEKVVVLYDIIDGNETLVLFWHHISILNGDTPSAKVTFHTSVLIPDAKTVCYNKGINKLYIIYNRPRNQELSSRKGMQGTDVLETRINGTICGKVKRLHIDHRRQEFFFLTDKGICVWGNTFPQKLIIERKSPWLMQLGTTKMNVYWIEGEHNEKVMFSTHQGSPQRPVCRARDILGLAVHRIDGTDDDLYTCTLRGGIRNGCGSSMVHGGRKQWQECVSMTASKGYLFMVNNKGETEYLSLKKKVLMKTKQYSVAITSGTYSKHPYNIQVFHGD